MSNVICPKCGKDDTLPFSDSKFHTHGFECHTCKKDFGVDDGNNIKDYEKSLISFKYERTYKDQTIKRIEIKKDGEFVYLTPSIVYPNKMIQPIEKQDITFMFEQLKVLLFEKIFILDWNTSSSVGLILPKNEIVDIKMDFDGKPQVHIHQMNVLPPYLPVLEQLFSSFFELQ